MNFITTPESRFKRLPNYQFNPNYLEVDGMRMHYLDEGSDKNNNEQKTILMLHGEPSWSYLYRHMIPVCVAAGHRVIAPDLIGFGKSDKPTEMNDYSYANHMDWMTSLIKQLDLKNMILVCQDWGSLIGLRLAAEHEDRFDAITVGNGMLPTGDEGKLPKVFKIWRAFAMYSPWFPIGRIVNSGSFKSLSKDELRAYDAPFPSAKYKAGARAFPRLVPTDANNPASPANRAAWKVLEKWQKPFLTCFSNGDPITRKLDKYMQERIPGAKGQPHKTLIGGHFLQEDSGAEFALEVNKLITRL
ncbi:MAG: haloalkane dehalogenase [Oleispira sp.]|nr:haloalkane dehalogenase [Oleispira sp.]